ncbi:MAG: hypothetical protein KC910_11640 [Candidatus Eremiobacteraeota bacterium]|nr:hypothetical protein [Candidatus Eremiobacteraeota bacterium]
MLSIGSLRAHPPASSLARATPPGAASTTPVDYLDLSAPPAPAQFAPKPGRRGKLLAALAGTALTVTAIAAISQYTPPPNPQMMIGYSGDADMSYDQVAGSLLESMGLAGVGQGYDMTDLARVAANPDLPDDSRLAAQELLADPILLNSMDVAGDGRVNRDITAQDLQRFAELQPDAGALTFVDLEKDLHTRVEDTNAFDYFDAHTTTDDSFNRGDLQVIFQDPGTPEAFREVAGEFLANPNLFNGFDVANADFSVRRFHGNDPSLLLDGVITRDDVKEVAYSPTPEEANQWTSLDREALERVAAGGELAPEMFTAFHQTDRGNCVATAFIKAAIDHYGGEVFESFSPNQQGGYDIVMRDGYRLQLTGQEMEAGTTATHFSGERNDTKSYANLLFTAAAKRAQLEGHEGAFTFGQALLSLNNGEGSRSVPHFLGLDDYVQKLELADVPGQHGVVVYGGGHAYYVDTVDGHTLGDRYGKPTDYQAKSHINEGEPSSGAVALATASP